MERRDGEREERRRKEGGGGRRRKMGWDGMRKKAMKKISIVVTMLMWDGCWPDWRCNRQQRIDITSAQ